MRKLLVRIELLWSEEDVDFRNFTNRARVFRKQGQ